MVLVRIKFEPKRTVFEFFRRSEIFQIDLNNCP